MDTSHSFFPFEQDDELSINFPEFPLWDFGFDHIPYYEGRPEEVEKVDSREGRPKEVEWIDSGDGRPKEVERIDLGDSTKGKEPAGELPESEARRNAQKKRMHRDIERQRRKEMANHYASLRSVLPPEILKGKRSTSDHIHEATKYIMHLQGSIKELVKKKNLYHPKKSLEDELLPDSEEGSRSNTVSAVVKVEPCSVGVEVLTSGDFVAEGLITLPLSRILRFLLQEGLNALSCNSAELDGKLHYAIQCAVPGKSGVSPQVLHKKLTCAINAWAKAKQ